MLLYTVIDDSDGDVLFETTDHDEACDCAEYYERVGWFPVIIRVEELVNW